YLYDCVEDTWDSLFCDSPDAVQDYRWAICGGGDPAKCVQNFPYVIADKNAKSDSMSWSTLDIDPKTGHLATGPGTLHVWAFRGRPIYTFYRDHDVDDLFGDGWGQDHGQHNGYRAFWIRDLFIGNGGSMD